MNPVQILLVREGSIVGMEERRREEKRREPVKWGGSFIDSKYSFFE